MASPAPALKDLPKVAENLKSQLEGFNTEQLKNASTQEKIILPSAEGKLFYLLFKLNLGKILNFCKYFWNKF